MDNAQIARSSLNDIVFDGRNKAYGAYVLRRIYQRHVTRALIIATSLFLLLISFPIIANYIAEKTKKPEVKKNLQVNELMEAPPLDAAKPPPPPPPPPPEAPPPPPPKVETVKFTPPVVKKDEEVRKVEEVPDVETLKETTVATKTQEGVKVDPNLNLNELSGEGTKFVEEVVDNKPYTYVEQMPQLPGGGGNAAIVAAIQKAIRYPPLALRNQVEGRIFVSFTVNSKGDVSDVKVVKGLGSGTDEETIRAVNSLPKFIPGKQNGRAVAVSFTLPITFKIQ